jgi:hypothetical protein
MSKRTLPMSILSGAVLTYAGIWPPPRSTRRIPASALIRSWNTISDMQQITVSKLWYGNARFRTH